jgi:hypothetical protein
MCFTFLGVITASFRSDGVSFRDWDLSAWLIRSNCEVPCRSYGRTWWSRILMSRRCFGIRCCSLLVFTWTRNVGHGDVDCQRIFYSGRLSSLSWGFRSSLPLVCLTSSHFGTVFIYLNEFNFFWIFASLVVILNHDACILCVCMVLDNLNAYWWDSLMLYLIHLQILSLNLIGLWLTSCLWCCNHGWIHSPWRWLFLNSKVLLLLWHRVWWVVGSDPMFSHRTGKNPRFSDIFCTDMSYGHHVLGPLSITREHSGLRRLWDLHICRKECPFFLLLLC